MPLRFRSPLPPRDLAWILALGILPLALLARPLWGGEALFSRDVLHYYWPMREAVTRLLSAGTAPQWDPGTMAGLPLLANIHAGVFYPFNLIHQVLSFERAYPLVLWFHLFLGACGLYAFLRARGLAPLSAGTGGLAWVACGPLLSLLPAGPLVCGAAWIPWVLWALARPFRWGSRTLLVAGALALQALSGDPQSVVYSGLAACAFLAFEAGPWRRFGAFFAGGALAAALCGVQLVPAWYLLRESTRAGGASRPGIIDWAFHPLRLIELVSPFPMGRYLGGEGYWGAFTIVGPSKQPFALSTYLGISVAVLAILGASRSRRAAPAWVLVATGLLLGLALGPFGWVQTHLPPFSLFRYPEKYVLLAALGAAWLAAEGMQALIDNRVGIRRLAWLSAGMVPLVLAFLVLGLAPGPSERSLSAAFEAFGWRVTGFVARAGLNDSLQHAVLLGALTLGLTWALVTRSSARRLVWLFPAVVAVDLSVAGSEIIWSAPRILFTSEPPLAQVLRERAAADHSRFIRDGQSLVAVAPKKDDLEHAALRRGWDVLTLKSNVGEVFGLEEASGYGAVILRRWQEVGAGLYGTSERLAQVFSACSAIASSRSRLFERAGWTRLGRIHPGVQLYGLNACPGRIHGVERLLGAADFEAALHRLKEEPLDLTKVAVVEGEPDQELAPVAVDSVAVAPDSIEARAVASGPGFVVVTTSWYPGWTGLLDGSSVPLVHTNGATFGIHVPPGEHRVRFEFHDPGLVPGMVISLVGLAAAVALFVLTRRRPVE
ncbi:MAG: hypothetical protein IRZ16_22900 [Myxococcaceae bacterium]|nr:hypothetical protein [Myxococcaceae bacterium]